MARRSFFATRADLEAGLHVIEARRPLHYIRCRAGRRLDGPELLMYDSLRDLEDLGIAQSGMRSQNVEYLIVDADTPVTLQERHYKDTVSYEVQVDPGAPSLYFEPGGLFENRILLACEISQVQLSSKNVDLYRLFAQVLTSNCISVWNNEYAPNALADRKQGIRFAWDLSYSGGNEGWTVQDVEEQRAHFEAMLAKKSGPRLDLAGTWGWLEEAGYDPPRNAKGKPHLPTLAYLRDDEDAEENEEGGLEFFKTSLDGDDLSHLTLPRLFVNRTMIERASFRDTDLRESAFRWNDWLDCDFTDAILFRADMRASLYVGCRFTNANLTGIDFRHSGLYECDFAGADLTGTKMTSEQGEALILTDTQRAVIRWMRSDGPEPPNG